MENLLASSLLLATGMTWATANERSRDHSTCRWARAKAIDAQPGPDASTLAAQNDFTQRYERYSFNGRIEAPR